MSMKSTCAISRRRFVFSSSAIRRSGSANLIQPFSAAPGNAAHCAASARKKNSVRSFESDRALEFSRGNDFLGERFEARLTAQVLKHRINPDRNDVIGGTLAIRSLQRIDGALLVA